MNKSVHTWPCRCKRQLPVETAGTVACPCGRRHEVRACALRQIEPFMPGDLDEVHRMAQSMRAMSPEEMNAAYGPRIANGMDALQSGGVLYHRGISLQGDPANRFREILRTIKEGR